MSRGNVYVECEEDTCAYYSNERCIAERISMVLEERVDDLRELVCDTYEHRDSWIPEPEGDPFEDENYAVDMEGKIV